MRERNHIIAETAKADLANQVGLFLAHQNGQQASRKMIRQVVVPMPRVDPLRWLHAQEAATKIYWSPRDGDVQVAAVGEADSCNCAPPGNLSQLRQHLAPILHSCDASVRYYGGFRFDWTMQREKAWETLGAYNFVLPRLELRCYPDRTQLICNLVMPRDQVYSEAIVSRITRLAPSESGPLPKVATPVARSVRPGQAMWRDMVEWALHTFSTSNLDKVVLAREALFTFAEPLCAETLLARLQSGTPNCFHFCFQRDGAAAFVGASPERLFRRCGRNIATEAVAGTRPRGSSAVDDARLLDELLQSEKDRREHEYVRISLREQLSALAEQIALDPEPSEMKLTYGRHLVSRMQATLRENVTTLDVLAALHPTPAVGGYPCREAIEAIRDQEPFDRGWYAGPVGWIGRNAAEFAVAIRSGLVRSNTLALFSGAGIVEGSTPESEWDEIEHKIIDFAKVLGLAEYHSQRNEGEIYCDRRQA